jgi:hypothetical protein
VELHGAAGRRIATPGIKLVARGPLIEAAGEVTAGEQLSPPTLQRLQRLWEWRMSALREQDQPDLEELEGFGWWFGSGRFAADWALTQLHELLAMGGTVQPDHTVAERLAALRHQHLAQVVGCLSLLIDAGYRHAPQRSWFVTGARDEIRAILEDAIRAEEPETHRLARETANRLVARGHTQFGDLLS